MRSFGPTIRNAVNSDVFHASCGSCIFLNGNNTCRYHQSERPIPDWRNTPEWCEMLAGYLRDAKDMAGGVKHEVIRWSGRKTDDDRCIYSGIPSEAARQFRLAARNVKRGTVRLVGERGETLEQFPQAVLTDTESLP